MLAFISVTEWQNDQQKDANNAVEHTTEQRKRRL